MKLDLFRSLKSIEVIINDENIYSIIAIVTIEWILFFISVLLTVGSIKKYQKHKLRIRLNNVIFCVGYTLVVSFILFTEFLELMGADQVLIEILSKIFNSLVVVTNCSLWNIYLTIFVKDENKKDLYRKIYFGIYALVLISYFFSEDSFLQYFVILGVILAVTLMISLTISPLKIFMTIKPSNNRTMMGLISGMGLSMTLSYISVLLMNIIGGFMIVPRYNLFYLLSQVFSTAGIGLFYIALIKPEWWAK